MEVKVERTSYVSWNILKEIIPTEYLEYIKTECINERHITVYTAGEEGKDASGYLVLTPVHHSADMYEIAHMQVALEDARCHVGSALIDSVAEDLKRNRIKSLCLSYDTEDDVPEAFFKVNGFENKSTFIVQKYNVGQLFDSVVHEKAEVIAAKKHFKSYDELSRVEKASLVNDYKLTINAGNKDNLRFLVLNDKIIAMNGIYHMDERIVLDDILIFDYSMIREIVLFTWSYFVEYVCDTYENENYSMAEIVAPTIKYEEASLKLIGDPVGKTIKQKMVLDFTDKNGIK